MLLPATQFHKVLTFPQLNMDVGEGSEFVQRFVFFSGDQIHAYSGYNNVSLDFFLSFVSIFYSRSIPIRDHRREVNVEAIICQMEKASKRYNAARSRTPRFY